MFTRLGRTQLRPRILFLALLVVSALLALPSGASAYRTFTVDIKAHPSKFKSGKQVDLPVYLVENRAPDDDPVSWFTEYPLGVRNVSFNYSSVHSKFVSFKPVAAFDYRGKYYYNKTLAADDRGESHVWLHLYSTKGLKTRPDNSGITGRTEARIGTLRVSVGKAIKKGSRKIVFDATLIGDPSMGGNGLITMWTKAGKENDVTGGGTVGMPRMAKKGIQVFNDDSSAAGMAPGDGVKSSPKKAKPGKKIKLKVKCTTDCLISPTLKIGGKTVKGLKDLKVKAGSRSVNFTISSKVTKQIKAGLKKKKKVVLTLTPKSMVGSGKPVSVQIK